MCRSAILVVEESGAATVCCRPRFYSFSFQQGQFVASLRSPCPGSSVRSTCICHIHTSNVRLTSGKFITSGLLYLWTFSSIYLMLFFYSKGTSSSCNQQVNFHSCSNSLRVQLSPSQHWAQCHCYLLQQWSLKLDSSQHRSHCHYCSLLTKPTRLKRP